MKRVLAIAVLSALALAVVPQPFACAQSHDAPAVTAGASRFDRILGKWRREGSDLEMTLRRDGTLSWVQPSRGGAALELEWELLDNGKTFAVIFPDPSKGTDLFTAEVKVLTRSHLFMSGKSDIEGKWHRPAN